jgi:hypothetical protein
MTQNTLASTPDFNGQGRQIVGYIQIEDLKKYLNSDE